MAPWGLAFILQRIFDRHDDRGLFRCRRRARDEMKAVRQIELRLRRRAHAFQASFATRRVSNIRRVMPGEGWRPVLPQPTHRCAGRWLPADPAAVTSHFHSTTPRPPRAGIEDQGGPRAVAGTILHAPRGSQNPTKSPGVDRRSSRRPREVLSSGRWPRATRWFELHLTLLLNAERIAVERIIHQARISACSSIHRRRFTRLDDRADRPCTVRHRVANELPWRSKSMAVRPGPANRPLRLGSKGSPRCRPRATHHSARRHRWRCR